MQEQDFVLDKDKNQNSTALSIKISCTFDPGSILMTQTKYSSANFIILTLKIELACLNDKK